MREKSAPAARSPPLSPDCHALLGQYRDRLGRRYDIAVRRPYGWGLYRTDLGDEATPHQTDPAALRRLISYDSLIRLVP